MSNLSNESLILDLVKQTAAISAHIVEIKEDLKDHMKRTAQVETELKFIHKQIWIAHGGIAALTLLGVVAKLWPWLVG